MKNSILPLIPGLFLCNCLLSGAINAQEESDDSSSKVRAVLADPRLRNMLRSVKNDPEAAAESIKNDPDELVNTATALFQKQIKANSDPAGVAADGEVPATRSNKNTAEQALEKLTDMIPDAASEVTALSRNPAIQSAVDAVASSQQSSPATQTAADTPPVPEPPAREAAVSEDSLAVPASAAPPMPSIGNTAPEVPSTKALSGDDIPAPRPLQAKSVPGSGASGVPEGPQNMEILARNSVMDNKAGNLLFTGDVRVNHPEFTIKSDRLEIFMTAGQTPGESSGGSPFKRAIASGGMVEIKRISPEGKTQIAMARRADYDAATKDIVLSGGPPYMQDGGSFVKTYSEDSQIILRGNGKYEVKGSERPRIVVPVEGGKSMTEQMGFDSGINIGQ